MNKLLKNKRSIYILFAFISIIIFYLSINVLYTQTANDLPSAERFVNNINITASQTNNSEVLIEWDGINNNNLIYYVYRSDSPITGKYSLVNSKVIDYIKATNTSKKYLIVDRPVLSSVYYYAVVSYIDNASFYNAKANIDTSSIIFNGSLRGKYTNQSSRSDVVTNTYTYQTNTYTEANTNTNTNMNVYTDTNTYKLNTNVYTESNIYTVTNTYTVSNTYTKTNTYVLTNTYTLTNRITNFYTNTKVYTNIIKKTNVYNLTNIYGSSVVPSGNGSSNVSGDYSRYKSEYDRAVAQFKAGNYLAASSILEPISARNIDRTLYYDINLLLGKCYKNLGRKNNALNVLNRIKTFNTQEVNFWINQVLSDL